MPKEETELLQCSVVRQKVLGVNVYRGFARLCDLANVSRADIYDQHKNPHGTQRDLSIQHAREAFEYIKTKKFGFWPEIFLSARNNKLITYYPTSEESPDIGTLEINISAVLRSRKIAIARVDGNHRLHFADGKAEGFNQIEKTVSFCLAYDLTRDEEIQLFKDINKNQKPMNTSHLDGIEARLTPEEELKRRQPELYIARQLMTTANSPLHGQVYDGGKRPVGVHIPLRGLKTGVEYMLSRSSELPKLDDADAQFKVIRNYFDAVKQWEPDAWSKPKEYIMLRGSGLWAICFIGAQVIDRSLAQGKFETESLLGVLKSGKKWDWSNKGDFKGFSGRGGALEISKQVTKKLHDKNRLSTNDLFEKIMKS